MHIACLDTESTSTGRYNEILELAIYSARGELVLNSLYKPKRNRRWPHSEKVHGISPDMVQDKPHFQDCLRKIQKIFDHARRMNVADANHGKTQLFHGCVLSVFSVRLSPG